MPTEAACRGPAQPETLATPETPARRGGRLLRPAGVASGPARPSWLVPALLIGAGAAVRAVFLRFPALDSDQAIIGLMGLHVLRGEYPTYFWGEAYSGTLESFLAAVLFFLLGSSRRTLALAPYLVSLGYLWVAWRLARELLGERAGRIALTLLAVPPVLLSWHGALARGNYIENLFFGTLCLLLAWRVGRADPASSATRRGALLLGGLAGFAWYMSFQSLSYLVVAAGYVAWRHRARSLRLAPLAAVGFLGGSLPFWTYNLATGFASLQAIRDHAGRVAPWHGIRDLLAALPVLAGAAEFQYTYEHVRVGTLPVLAPTAAIALAIAAAAALAAALGRRSVAGIVLASHAAAVVGLILAGGVALDGDVRYLLPLYTSLPLLAAAGLAAAPRRLALGVLGLVLACHLYSHWTVARGEAARFPRYRAEDRELLTVLRRAGVRFAYAPDYWQSYRLTFDAGEAPIIATPFWRDHPRAHAKFPPYTLAARVEGAAIYVLLGSVEVYRNTLRTAGVAHEATSVGRYTLLHGFHRPPRGASLPSGAWSSPTDTSRRAFDRDPWTSWRGTDFQLDLGEVYRPGYLVVHLGDLHRTPDGLVIEGSVDAQRWRQLARLGAVVPGFAWVGERLVLEEHGRVGVSLPPGPIRYLRIAADPPGRRWALAELFVFEPGPGGAHAPALADAIVLEDDQRWNEALSRFAARLLDDPDDEEALTRALMVARQLGLAGWAQVHDRLSARHLGRDPALALRFARRFHELAPHREAAWRRLALALHGVGAPWEAAAVEAERARRFTPAVALEVEFGRDLKLLGYSLEPSRSSPGERAAIRYLWQLLRPPAAGLWVAVHVLGPPGGRRLYLDHPLPADGVPGERILDEVFFPVPSDLAPGSYPLRVGVWQPATGRRLRVTGTRTAGGAYSVRTGALDVAPWQRVLVDLERR